MALTNRQADRNGTTDSGALALQAIVFILSDDARAERFVALSGITPDDLRASLTERATHAAALRFLTAHEPDLIACAAALQVSPATLAAAAHALDQYGLDE